MLALRARTALIDGENVVARDDGVTDFGALRAALASRDGEIKHDGYRFLVRRNGDRVRVFSRAPTPGRWAPGRSGLAGRAESSRTAASEAWRAPG